MGLSLGQELVSEPRRKHSSGAHGACVADRQHTDSCGLNNVSGGDGCCGGTEAGWRRRGVGVGGGGGGSLREGRRGRYYSVRLFGKNFSKKMAFGCPWWSGS